jgi:hypothetical protein
VYYNRILRVWVIDPLDCFLISVIIGSILASHLKNYLSEKASMERLKRSIINKSNCPPSETNLPILSIKQARTKKIYNFALRGGQFDPPVDELQAAHEFSNEIFNLAQGIRRIIYRLATFLKKRELKGIANIFFKNGKLILELVLYKCQIDITYSILTNGLSNQVIILTSTLGGALGFTISWFSVGAILVSPPLLISVLLLRSATQQILNQRDYSNFKKMVNKMLDDDELKETIRAFFIEGEGQTNVSEGLKMKLVDSNENFELDFKFNSEPDENLEEFTKARMKEELGLVENPTESQFKEIIDRKVKRKPRRKTILFGEFIDEIGVDLPDDDFIDAEIIRRNIPKDHIRIDPDKEF